MFPDNTKKEEEVKINEENYQICMYSIKKKGI